MARPLGICVWDLDALIHTCDVISRDSSFDKKWRQLCQAFLAQLDEEKVLLLGMMADASDEVLQLVRFFDKEAFAIEQMAERVQTFMQTVRALFPSGECLRTGFTKLCLQHLQVQKSIPDGAGGVRGIGGPTFNPKGPVVRRCLQRMAAWSRVVQEVAATEFPDWELLGAFAVFRLEQPQARARPVARPLPSPIGCGAEDCLHQLASAFHVDPRQLREEFQNHQRLAQGHKYMQPATSDADAWRHALASTQRNRKTRETWSAKALLPVLERFFVCPGSTAGIEQTFSLFKRITGEQWHGTEAAEERRLVLTLEARRAPAMPGELLADAQRIWRANFHPTRERAAASLGVRALVLLRRQAQRPRAGAAGWLEQRRLATAKAALVAPAQSKRSVAAADSTAAWTEKHEAEVQHQKEERHARACAAVEEGTAQRSVALGGPATAAAAMRAFHAKETARAHEMALNQKRQQAIRAAPRPIALQGARVFVEDAARQVLDKPPGKWSQLRRSLKLQEEKQRNLASIVVVLNPVEPGDRARFVSAVLGQALCSPSRLLGEGGPWLQMQRAVRLPRYLFVSAAVQAKHGAMVDLLKAAAGSAKGGRWRWFADIKPDRKTFWSFAALRGKKHESEMMTLVKAHERATFARWPRIQTLTEFFKRIRVIDRARSVLGPCGR